MKIDKRLQEKIDRVVKEKIDIVPYDDEWSTKYNEEELFLKSKFPNVIRRIEHFGSTAVPGLSAKPIVDILVEVSSLSEAKKQIVPVLESLGYDYFWRTDAKKPYAWFIKRDPKGGRTHHIHMVEKDSDLWDRLYFRDYLKDHPDRAAAYEDLKINLARLYPNDREAYTRAKSAFIVETTELAKRYYSK